MKVLLLSDVPNLGKRGDVKVVSDGYATNFLFTRKLACLYDEHAKHIVDSEEKKKSKVKKRTTGMSKRIEDVVVVISVKSHDQSKMYGSVHAQDIINALSKDHKITVSKSQIDLEKSIKEFGMHYVTISLSSSISARLKVKVVRA